MVKQHNIPQTSTRRRATGPPTSHIFHDPPLHAPAAPSLAHSAQFHKKYANANVVVRSSVPHPICSRPPCARPSPVPVLCRTAFPDRTSGLLYLAFAWHRGTPPFFFLF